MLRVNKITWTISIWVPMLKSQEQRQKTFWIKKVSNNVDGHESTLQEQTHVLEEQRSQGHSLVFAQAFRIILIRATLIDFREFLIHWVLTLLRKYQPLLVIFTFPPSLFLHTWSLLFPFLPVTVKLFSSSPSHRDPFSLLTSHVTSDLWEFDCSMIILYL